MSDLISRQAAVDAIDHICPVDTEYDCTLLDRVDVRYVLSDLPSAQPDVPDTNVGDLISRQAVKELAHNQMREKYCGAALKKERDFYIKLADSIINLLPSAQPEIIRCRECKFASGDSRICMKFDHSPIGELDFCSFAERREVNNESN